MSARDGIPTCLACGRPWEDHRTSEVVVCLPAHRAARAEEVKSADARLSVAAPDLLAACETLFDRMTDGRDETDAATLEEWSRDLRAAIVKARGKP